MKQKIKFLLFHSQRLVKSFQLRRQIAKLQSAIKGKLDIPGESKLIDSLFEITAADALHKFGYFELPQKVSEDIISDLLQETENYDLIDPFNRNLGSFSKKDIPQETHVANYKRVDLSTSKAILDLANDPGILRIVQDFLGCKPTISNINMWWSLRGKNLAKDAQLFHRDVDDIKFCKFFIYLTDVGENDGPHAYVQGSSSTNKLTKIRRYQDSEIITAFGQNSIINFTRPKGSCFLVDTYGFHKGTLPVDNDRLLLQIQYSINPIGIENYNPVNHSHKYQKYINRLIIK
jgi:hypothetical protein